MDYQNIFALAKYEHAIDPDVFLCKAASVQFMSHRRSARTTAVFVKRAVDFYNTRSYRCTGIGKILPAADASP